MFIFQLDLDKRQQDVIITYKNSSGLIGAGVHFGLVGEAKLVIVVKTLVFHYIKEITENPRGLEEPVAFTEGIACDGEGKKLIGIFRMEGAKCQNHWPVSL